MINLIPGDVIFDIESYPNIFCITAYNVHEDVWYYFEISDRIDQSIDFYRYLISLNGSRLVGFNSQAYDMRVLVQIYEHLRRGVKLTAKMIFDISDHAIHSDDWTNGLPDVLHLDLFRINHYHNRNKSVSLKKIEMYLRLDNVEELPYPVGSYLAFHEMDQLALYNRHDVKATYMFYRYCRDLISIREIWNEPRLLISPNSEIGMTIFFNELRKLNPGLPARRKIVVNDVPFVNLKDVILPKIRSIFPTSLSEYLGFFDTITVDTSKREKTHLSSEDFYGTKAVVGLGGFHASVNCRKYVANETHTIIDLDFKSFYPFIGFANGLYPKQIGPEFCQVYKGIYDIRATFAPKTPKNLAYKEALNTAFGSTNDIYSPFYDPEYFYSITANGQLVLLILCEGFTSLGCELIQANTDGLTLWVPRDVISEVDRKLEEFEAYFGFIFERTEFNIFACRDVNNYVGQYTNGKIKAIGAYRYDIRPDQDPSMLIVAKAASDYIVLGNDYVTTIYQCNDMYDFMVRATSSGGYVRLGDRRVGKIARLYASNDGDKVYSVIPPKGTPGHYKKKHGISQEYYNLVTSQIGVDVWDERIHFKSKSKYGEAEVRGTFKGQTFKLCNRYEGKVFVDLNRDYYVKEVEELITKGGVVWA